MSDLMPGTTLLGFTEEPHVVIAVTPGPKPGRPAVILAVSLNPETHHRYATWVAYTRDGGLSWDVERGDYELTLADALTSYSARNGDITLADAAQTVTPEGFPVVVAVRG